MYGANIIIIEILTWDLNFNHLEKQKPTSSGIGIIAHQSIMTEQNDEFRWKSKSTEVNTVQSYNHPESSEARYRHWVIKSCSYFMDTRAIFYRY